MKLRLAMVSMGRPETKVSTLCVELGITRQTLYRHLSPDGQLRADGIKLLNKGVIWIVGKIWDSGVEPH